MGAGAPDGTPILPSAISSQRRGSEAPWAVAGKSVATYGRRRQRCDACGCDRVNGYVPGEDCPDCEPCTCGHSAFLHAHAFAVPAPCDVDDCDCDDFRPDFGGPR